MKETKKARLKKQLLSTGIYIALAATVVGVTTSTVAKLISGTQDSVPDVTQTKYQSLPNEAPVLPEIPELSHTEASPITPPSSISSHVSGAPQGVSAQITESSPSDTEQAAEAPSISQTSEDTTESQNTSAPDFGYPGYVKPCGAIISREYSDDVLVYSPTMYDYRVHTGVDIAAELLTPVKAVAGGIVTDISYDDMFGQTVTIKSPDGLILRYCNLAQELAPTIKPDAVVKTSQVIGGVGKTALCEAAEAPHLHLEAIRDGETFDPTTLFMDEADLQQASATFETEFE